MYNINEKGIGKKVCNQDGATLLSDSLSQNELKRLHELNCEFITYVKQQKREETEKPTEVPATKESPADNSTGSTGRKQDGRKGTRKSKAD